jgi:hypothetical protein
MFFHGKSRPRTGHSFPDDTDGLLSWNQRHGETRNEIVLGSPRVAELKTIGLASLGFREMI